MKILENAIMEKSFAPQQPLTASTLTLVICVLMSLRWEPIKPARCHGPAGSHLVGC